MKLRDELIVALYVIGCIACMLMLGRAVFG
jgi:hypothetical protein